MCCRHRRSHHGAVYVRQRHPTLLRMLVEHIVQKRQQKKALGSASAGPSTRSVQQERILERESWVDEKQNIDIETMGIYRDVQVEDAVFVKEHGERDDEEDVERARLPSYREVMKA